MLELVVLFALAALGSFFRDEEEARMSAAAVPVPDTGRRDAARVAMPARVAFDTAEPERPAPAAPLSPPVEAAAVNDDIATESFLAGLRKKLASAPAPDEAAASPDTIAEDDDETLWESHDALFAFDDMEETDRVEADAAKPETAETREEPAEDVAEDDAIVVVVPQDYAGPCEVELADAPSRDGRPAAHILVDGQVVAELAGMRAADIPLGSISVVEDDAEEVFA